MQWEKTSVKRRIYLPHFFSFLNVLIRTICAKAERGGCKKKTLSFKSPGKTREKTHFIFYKKYENMFSFFSSIPPPNSKKKITSETFFKKLDLSLS